MENNNTLFEQADTNVTPMKAGLKYGLYLGLAMVVFSLIAHYGGLQDYNSVDIANSFLVTAITYIILAVLFFLGVRYFKNSNEGQLTFGEGMTTAMFIGVISGLISVVFTFIFFSYIAPDVMESVTNAAMEQVNADMSELSEEERQKSQEMMGSVMGIMQSPIVMAMSTFVARLFSAVIFGLISSLILKTD